MQSLAVITRVRLRQPSFYSTTMAIMHQTSLLNTLTTAFLDIAERRARRQLITTMADWKQVLEQYLQVADADNTLGL